MTFELKSIIPEGYEDVAYREAKTGELYLNNGGVSLWDRNCASKNMYIILRKKWTPQPRELCAAKCDGLWYLVMCVKRSERSGELLFDNAIEATTGCSYDEYRQLTDEELAALFPRRES